MTPLRGKVRRPRRTEDGRKRIIGWREWVALPRLGVPAIKAKLDTGARSSAIHAFDVQPVWIDGREWVRFSVHPRQRNDSYVIPCLAPLIDRRWVSNPGGRRERRTVIAASVWIDDEEWPIDLSLTDRDEMGFRLLIGRSAMKGRLVIDPTRSYCAGRQLMKRCRADDATQSNKPGET